MPPGAGLRTILLPITRHCDVNRALRRLTGWICLAGFLVMQVSLAAYACPLRAPAPPAAAGAVVAHDALDRCPGHADADVPDPGPLCEAHCEGQAGVTGSSGPSLPPPVLAPFPVALPLDAHPVAIALVARTPPAANAAAPPVAQRFCRLLI